MDYEKEFKKLEAYEQKNWFKPTKGSYLIKVIGEGETIIKTFGSEIAEQWIIPINILERNGKEEKEPNRDETIFWSITKGKTLSSLYGMIISLANNNNNKATNLKFNLHVKFDNKKNEYVIPEALYVNSTKEEMLK